MASKNAGIYQKFYVKRTDGSSEIGEKHCQCFHFVLDLDHDPFARVAARAYMDACQEEYPSLASDLAILIAQREPAPPRSG